LLASELARRPPLQLRCNRFVDTSVQPHRMTTRTERQPEEIDTPGFAEVRGERHRRTPPLIGRFIHLRLPAAEPTALEMS